MRNDHSIAALCAALEVTPAGYHAWARAEPGPRERADAELAEQIAAIHGTHRGRSGAPRIQRELLARGKAHSRKRIARLMRERGLNAHRPPRYVPRTTDSSHDEPIASHRIAPRPAPP
jgi:transposase InsO family protein